MLIPVNIRCEYTTFTIELHQDYSGITVMNLLLTAIRAAGTVSVLATFTRDGHASDSNFCEMSPAPAVKDSKPAFNKFKPNHKPQIESFKKN